MARLLTLTTAVVACTAALLIACGPAAVSAHDAPAAFLDPRDAVATGALEDARRLAAEARAAGLFTAETLRGTDECDKCRDTTQLVLDVLVSDPTLVETELEKLLCDKQTTAASNKIHNNNNNNGKNQLLAAAAVVGGNKDECKKIVGDIVKALAKLATRAVNGEVHIPAVLCNDILRKCTVPCCDTATTPEQIHLSIPTTDAVNGGAMAVSWTTMESTPLSLVEWWPTANGNATSSSAIGTNFTYTHGGWIGVLHTATMTGLATGTTYSYRVGASRDGPWSPTFDFTTFPSNIGTPARPLRAIQIADMGCGDNGKPTIAAIAARVAAGEVDVVFHPGDIGYDDGDEHIWDLFMRAIQPVAARVPYMTAPGNHELLWNFSAYKRRFPAMPAPSVDTTSTNFDDVAMFYELRVNSFTFFMLDSESVIDTAEITPMQADWFARAAMAASTAGQSLLTMTHRPMYCSSGSSNCEEMAALVRDGIERTLNRAGVLLHTTGHLHEYERTLPIGPNGTTAKTFASNASYTNPTAPTYIVNGAAGNPAGQNSFKAIQPWSVLHTLDVGYNVWSMWANGSATFISSQFINSGTGAVVDSFTITRGGNG